MPVKISPEREYARSSSLSSPYTWPPDGRSGALWMTRFREGSPWIAANRRRAKDSTSARAARSSSSGLGQISLVFGRHQEHLPGKAAGPGSQGRPAVVAADHPVAGFPFGVQPGRTTGTGRSGSGSSAKRTALSTTSEGSSGVPMICMWGWASVAPASGPWLQKGDTYRWPGRPDNDLRPLPQNLQQFESVADSDPGWPGWPRDRANRRSTSWEPTPGRCRKQISPANPDPLTRARSGRKAGYMLGKTRSANRDRWPRRRQPGRWARISGVVWLS